MRIAFILNDGRADFSGVKELCEAYNLGRPYVIAHSHELREQARAIFPEAKILAKLAGLKGIAGEGVLTVKVYSGAVKNSLHSLEVRRKCLEHEGSILFLISEEEADLDDIAGMSGYLYERRLNIPLNVKTGIALDKFLGKR